MHTPSPSSTPAVPTGVSFAGLHCGIKRSRLDLGLIVFEQPCVVASVVTQNPVRAACVDRTAAIGTSEGIRAIVVNSGNANALTGAPGVQADQQMAAGIATAIGCEPSQVLTSSTGVVGVPLHVEAIVSSAAELVNTASEDPSLFAEAILTTDTCTKVVSKTVETDAGPITVLGVAKGSGMIHPNMATTLGFVVTDALVSPALLERLLKGHIESTFNAISVDGDTSTNDAVFACATGASGIGIESGPELDAFVDAFHGVLLDLAKQVAADGEGATRLLTVKVQGAPSDALAQSLARGICRGSLFKCSVFTGEASAYGRLAAAAGQCALEQGIPIDLGALAISAQGLTVVEHGAPVPLAANPEPGFDNPLTELLRRLRGPEVEWTISIGDGPGSARAYGCDLTYDYVRINADESRQVEVQASGAVGRSLSLARYSPKLKHELLVDGLAYVRRFAGMRVAIEVSSSLGKKPLLVDTLCEDLDLLIDAGLRPWVVTHDESLTQSLLDGLTPRALAIPPKAVGEPAALGRLIDRGVCVVETAPPDPSSLVARCIRLGVGKLLVLGDGQGLSDRTGLVSLLSRSQALAGLEHGRFSARSAEYLALTRHAANQGLPALHLIDGRLPHALVAELFTTRGIGTLVTDQSQLP